MNPKYILNLFTHNNNSTNINNWIKPTNATATSMPINNIKKKERNGKKTRNTENTPPPNTDNNH